MATEIANAYVALTVKAPNIKKDIESELGNVDSDGAGGKIATGLGRGITNKQAALAGAVGGIFASLANTAATALGDLFGDAVVMSDSVDKFKSSLSFAGFDTAAIDAAAKSTRAYADQTVYDLASIQKATSTFAANGVEDYTGLTEAAGNLNAVAGGNAGTFDSVTLAMGQVTSAGKLTAENWNQIADAIPGASGMLQEALESAGAYTGDFRAAMEKGEITAEEFNTAVMTLGNEPIAVEAASSVTTMEGAVGNLSAAITGNLSDAFTSIKPMLAGAIGGLAEFFANIEAWTPLLAGIGAAILYAIAPSLWAAATATWAWTAALLANPMTWIILGIVALVAAIVWLIQNWDTAVAWITEVWGGFIGWITGVIDGFVGWWNGIWAAVGEFIASIWNGIVTWVTQMVLRVSTVIRVTILAVQKIWNGIWRGVGSFFKGIWDGIVSAVESFKGVFEGVFGGIKGFVKAAFSGVVGIIKAPINGIIGLINGAIGALNGISVSIPDWVPLFGGQTFGISLPTIPMLAEGGTITRAGSVIVGERGPELLRLPAGASVDPNIAGAGPATISDASMDRLAVKVAAALVAVRSGDARDARAAVMSGVR